MAGATTDSLTQEEVDYLAQSTLSKKIGLNGDVNQLDAIDSPTTNFLQRRAKDLGAPVNGGFKFFVKGRRGQKIQWWDGADILTFENRHTLTDMQFTAGKGHMGYELLYEFITRHGIRVDMKKGIREGGAASTKTLERVVNVIEDHLDSVRADWRNDLRKRVFRANTDQSKCFTGWDGLFPATGNTSGTIGGRNRSNPLFRHQLITGVSADTLQSSFFKMIRLLTRKAGNSKVEFISCGDLFYNALVDLFSGTSTVAGKFDYRAQRDMAMKRGEKMNIGLPQNCFMYDDVLIVNDPVYVELDEDEPARSVPWSKQCIFINPTHFGLVPIEDEVVVPHGMPYNQRLERASYHGEWVEWCNQPGTQGVMTLT